MATTALVTFSDFAAAVSIGYRSSVRVKDVVKSVACAWPLQSIGLSRQDRQSKRVLGGKLYVCLSEPAEAVLTPARAPPQTRALAWRRQLKALWQLISDRDFCANSTEYRWANTEKTATRSASGSSASRESSHRPKHFGISSRRCAQTQPPHIAGGHGHARAYACAGAPRAAQGAGEGARGGG
jgi:hypothetical protein